VIENPPEAFMFETERLVIRPLRAEDERFFTGLYTDADTMRFIAPPMSLERARRTFLTAVRLSQAANSHVFLKLTEKIDRHEAGICAIQSIDLRGACAEAGIVLAPQARSRRLAREGLASVMRKAFDVLPISYIWLQTDPRHVVVQRMLIGVGLERSEDAAFAAKAGPDQHIWVARRGVWTVRNEN
jgi:RimJ/RimL family protein N-acetyltransferase